MGGEEGRRGGGEESRREGGKEGRRGGKEGKVIIVIRYLHVYMYISLQQHPLTTPIHVHSNHTHRSMDDNFGEWVQSMGVVGGCG